MAKKMKTPDVKAFNHGTLIQVFVLSEAARDWVNEKVNVEDYMVFNGGFYSEPRYAEDIFVGMADDGLKVEVGQ